MLDASEVSRQELFHSLQTQFLSCVASFESIARRPLSLGSCHAPFFLEENVAVRFLLRERYFDNSRTQRLLKIANIEALDSQA